MRVKTISVLSITATIMLFFLLGYETMANELIRFKKIEDVPVVQWEKLAQKKIYFAHQSVGFNIIDGINEIIQETHQIKLKIIETRKIDNLFNGTFAHSKIGENNKPITKIDDFVGVLDNALNGLPDIAFLKLCYVDMSPQIDVKKTFMYYKDAIRKLRIGHPDLIIIHFTIPLTTQAITWKTKLKKLLGKEPWEFTNNIKRNQFNNLLLMEYGYEGLIFDIAGYEATQQNGSKSTFTFKGKQYLSMNPAYSSDGGHLNELGRKIIAEQLLIFLAERS